MSIELPVDANGMTVPLDTSVMYRDDNSRFPVTDFFYEAKPNRWFARNGNIYIETSRLHLQTRKKNCYEQLIADDSWDKLEDDLNRVVENNDAFYEASCAYMNQSGAVCNGCRLHGRHTRNCTEEMFKDVVSRIRKLKGED